MYDGGEAASFKSFFAPAKRKVGRPRKARAGGKTKKKKAKTKALVRALSSNDTAAAAAANDELQTMLEATAPKKPKATRRNWSKGVAKQFLDRGAKSFEDQNDWWEPKDTKTSFLKRLGIPHLTVARRLQQRTAGTEPAKRGRHTLLSADEANEVVTLVQALDEAKNPANRGKVLAFVKALTKPKGFTMKQLGNTWQRTIHPKAKADGKLTGLVVAQAGTDGGTASGAEHLQRSWHTTVDDAFDRLRKLNAHIPNFENIMHHFVFNLDEECLMAAGYTDKVYGTNTTECQHSGHESAGDGGQCCEGCESRGGRCGKGTKTQR